MPTAYPLPIIDCCTGSPYSNTYLWYASEMQKQRTDEPVAWREGRRMRAWELHQHGWKQKDIAAALGGTQGAVSQWVKRGNDGGVPALRRRTASGSAPRLSIEQREQLRIALAKGAPAYGFVRSEERR